VGLGPKKKSRSFMVAVVKIILKVSLIFTHTCTMDVLCRNPLRFAEHTQSMSVQLINTYLLRCKSDPRINEHHVVALNNKLDNENEN